MWKALSVFAALLAAGAAFLSYLNKQDLEKEDKLLVTAEQNLGDIDARFNEVKDYQVNAERRTGKMEVRRDAALVKQEEAKQRLADKEQEVADTNTRIAELKEEIASAKEKIAEFGNIGTLVALIEQLQSDLFTAKNDIAALEGRLASTKTRAEQTADRIQNYKDLEHRQRNGQMVTTSASISSVYNTWGFVVLNQGDSQGIVTRTKFDVNRGGEKIAELVVTNLEKNRSVCDIVPGSMQPGQMLRPGDSISVNPDSLPKPKAELDPNQPIGLDPNLPGAGLPMAPAADPMAPAPDGVPAGETDPFGDLETPATTPASDDPFADLQ